MLEDLDLPVIPCCLIEMIAHSSCVPSGHVAACMQVDLHVAKIT